MATPSTRLSLIGLAKRLAKDGLLDEAEAAHASEAAAARETSRWSPTWSKTAGLDAAQIALCASTEFGLPVFDLDAFDAELLSLHGVSDQIIRKYRALPLFRRGNRLFAAVSDPTDYRALDEIKFSSGLSTEAVLVPHDKLSALLAKVLASSENQPLDDINDADLDALVVQDEGQRPGAPAPATSTSTTRRWCATSTNCCWTPSARAPRTCISSRTRSATGSATGWTASCARWRRHRRAWPTAWRPASRCWRAWTLPSDACRRTDASS